MVYVSAVPVTVRPVSVSGIPSLESCVSTISSDRSASSTAGPNSTTQARVTSDPTTIGRSTLLVIATEAGLGTVRDYTIYIFMK